MFKLSLFFWTLRWVFRGWEQEVDIQENEDGESLKGLRIIIGTWTPEETEDRVAGILRDTVDIYAGLPHHLSNIAKDAIDRIHKIREEGDADSCPTCGEIEKGDIPYCTDDWHISEGGADDD